MRLIILLIFYVVFAIALPIPSQAGNTPVTTELSESVDSELTDAEVLTAAPESGGDEGEHHQVPIWLVIPFVLLLVLIASGPLFFEHFWHKNYPYIAAALAAIVVCYYLFAIGDYHGPLHAVEEYVPFISLLAALYIASGGIAINIDRQATPMTNVLLLLVGAVIANLIGTTGASMLLIRPFIRLNKTRIRPYHIIFFIFVVSNVGGSLTPIGDPPLFLGFLRGVPFEWTLIHNLLPWAFASTILVTIFYFFDSRNKGAHALELTESEHTGKMTLIGKRNFLWLAVVIGAVFLDPNVFPWIPAIEFEGKSISFVKELIWVAVAVFSFIMANKEAHKVNAFSFEPIREVAFIFIGIFGTMTPALELVGNFAKSPAGIAFINHNTLYWGTGILSGFLDNAPTYVNFLTAALASKGGDIGNIADVKAFAAGGYEDSVLYLSAISVAAVFFGAMTYIGNGPNFMVKSIAEEIGIKMPSFFGYIIRYSIPVLIPVLILVWVIFFLL